MAPANDNEDAARAFREYKDLVKGAMLKIREAIVHLRDQNAALKQEAAEKDAKIEEYRTATTSLREEISTAHREFDDMIKAILGVVAIFVIGGIIGLWALGARFGGTEVAGTKSDKLAMTQAVKDGVEPLKNDLAAFGTQLAANKKAFDQLNEKVDDNAAKGNKLASAVAQLATSGQLTTNGDVVTMDNWTVLNATARAKIFQDACQGKVKWDSVNTELYQAGLVYIKTKEEAQQLISSCDVNAIVKKAPTTTTEANNTDPNADEDAAAQQAAATPAVAGPQDQAAGNVQKAGCERGSCNLTIAPSPFAQPAYGSGYGSPPYGAPGYGRRGTPRCPSGMYFEGDRCRTPLRQLPLTAYQAGVLQNCPTRIETRWVSRGTRMVQQQRCAPSL